MLQCDIGTAHIPPSLTPSRRVEFDKFTLSLSHSSRQSLVLQSPVILQRYIAHCLKQSVSMLLLAVLELIRGFSFI